MRISAISVWMLAGFASAGAMAASCDGFSDVDSSASYCTAVTYLKNTGITVGCTGTTYCPNDSVTRAQMALYLYRLGNNVVFQQGGNAFGTTAKLGTTDTNALEVDIHAIRVMRFEQPNATSPNLIGGSPSNAVVSDGNLPGNVISGGGASGSNCLDPTVTTYTAPCANRAFSQFSVIGGGFGNKAGGDIFGLNTVGGGFSNYAIGGYSTVAGGYGNLASSGNDTVSGGSGNIAEGSNSSVTGGSSNLAGGNTSIVAGGSYNSATGYGAAILGGESNNAKGDYSVVIGENGLTTANATGSFVFSDSTSNGGVAYGSGNPNEFLVAASGGIRMNTAKDYTTGCSIPAGGGAWACSSSRDIKRDFSAVDPADILVKVAALPIMRWRYMNEPTTVRHIGTFAQDFRAAFGLGENDTTISTVDADGIAMAAIQGLNAKVDARDQVIADLQAQLAQLRRQMADLAKAR